MPGIIPGGRLLGIMLESRNHPSYVIPSVAEESKMPAIDSLQDF